MRSVPSFLLSKATAAVLACGDSPRTADLADAVQRAELTKEEARNAVRFPCPLCSQAVASALMNAALDAPIFSLVHRNEDGDAWSSVAGNWNSLDSGPDQTVWLGAPEHFDGSAVQCFGLEPEDNVEPALGTQSSWRFQAAFGWSRLRGCGEGYLFQVEVMDGPIDEAARGLPAQVGQRLVEILAGAVGR